MVSFFGEASKEKTPLISSKNTKYFFIEQNKIKENINLNIPEVSGKKAKTIYEKIHKVSILRIEKKRKRAMETVDFLNIGGQQRFEEKKIANPIEILIESDRVQNMIEKHKKYSKVQA